MTHYTSGFVAYKIDETVIARKGAGGPDSPLDVEETTRPFSETPNFYTGRFQNEENNYQTDSLSVSDFEGVTLAGEEVQRSLGATGVQSFDQQFRLANVKLATGLRGNHRGDAAGTKSWKFTTSFRVEHLRVGQILLFDLATADLNTGLESPPLTPINGVLVRVREISANSNYHRMTVTVDWHNDVWYTDAFGQGKEPLSRELARDRLPRPSWPWQPNEVAPDALDPLYDASRLFFGVETIYQDAADATGTVLLRVTGKLPVNDPANIERPLVPDQAQSSSTGGTIAGDQTVYIVVTAKEATGADYKQSQASQVMSVVIPAGTNTNTIDIVGITWPSSSAGYVVYAGPSHEELTYQADADTTPANITITALNERVFGQPDLEFDRILVRTKTVAHSGVWGAQVTGVTATTMTVASAGWTVNEWANRIITLIGKIDGSGVPVANFKVASNTADTLTLLGGQPSPVALGMVVGDVIVCRIIPQSITADTFTDPLFVNSFAGGGLNVNEEAGRLARIIDGPGKGEVRVIKSNTSTEITLESPWGTTPTADSVIIIELTGWETEASSEKVNNSRINTAVALDQPVTNLANSTLLVQAATVDGGGNESVASLSPLREIYILGTPGSIIGGIAPTGHVTAFDASEDLILDANGARTHEITVTFTEPAPLGTYGGTRFLGRLLPLAAERGGADEQQFAQVLDIPDGSVGSDRTLLYPFTAPIPKANIPAWAPSTSYLLGDQVVEGGTIYRAKADFASGGSFVVGNWDVLAEGYREIELIALAYNTAGTDADVLTAPTTLELLDAINSPPVAPSNPFCQLIPSGARVSWDQGSASDFSHSVVAWMANLVPFDLLSPVDPDTSRGIKDHQIIKVVPATRAIRNSADPGRPEYVFQETLYTGTIGNSGADWWIDLVGNSFEVNQLVVETALGVFSGMNIQFIGPAEENGTVHPSNGNTATRINLTAAPSFAAGTKVRFYIRGADGNTKLYVANVDVSGQRSSWVEVANCTPFAPDGTLDQGLPDVHNIFFGFDDVTEAFYSVGPVGLSNLYESVGVAMAGHIGISAVARGLEETETDVDLAVKANINGIRRARVTIKYRLMNDATNREIEFEQPITSQNFAFNDGTAHPDYSTFWTATVKLNPIYIPDAELYAADSVQLQLLNSHGWSPPHDLGAKFVPTAGLPLFTGSASQVVTPIEITSGNLLLEPSAKIDPEHGSRWWITMDGADTIDVLTAGRPRGEALEVCLVQPTSVAPFTPTFGAGFKVPVDEQIIVELGYKAVGRFIFNGSQFELDTVISNTKVN